MILTDKAWRLIVSAATTPSGVRGKVFRMSRQTALGIAAERRQTAMPTNLYGVFIRLDDYMRYGDIELEER